MDAAPHKPVQNFEQPAKKNESLGLLMIQQSRTCEAQLLLQRCAQYCPVQSPSTGNKFPARGFPAGQSELLVRC